MELSPNPQDCNCAPIVLLAAGCHSAAVKLACTWAAVPNASFTDSCWNAPSRSISLPAPDCVWNAHVDVLMLQDENGRSRGFGFVNFEKPDAAHDAVEALSGKELAEGKELYVGRAQKKSEREASLKHK